MAKISVIIPIYNSEKYLKKCLDSVVNQTFHDKEIICVNDGSTDSSLEILKQYSNIKIISQENKGLSEARNTGIKAAQGEYIGFVDSDDWVDLNFYEKLYNSITKNDADIACATIKRRKNKYRVMYKEEKVYTDLEEKIRICGLLDSSYVWNKLYKAQLIKQNLFTPNVYFEDMIWTPNVIKQSEKLVTVPNTIYYYRANINSIVKKCPSKKKQCDFYNAKKYVVRFFDENHIKLSENERYITKRKYYFCNILLLKIKEYRYNTEYHLFGFIPIFKITKYPELGEEV